MDVHAWLRRIPERARRILALIGAVLLALGAARPGGNRLAEMVSGARYHYAYNFLGEAALWLTLAAAAITLAVYGFRRDDWRLTAAAAALALLVLAAQPLAFDHYHPMRANTMAADLANLRNDIESFRSRTGHLPFTRQEIATAVNINGMPTAIFGSGRQYTYRFIVAGQRDDIFATPPVGAEPGDIYYTVSSDEQGFALSVVGIDGNVSDRLIIDRFLSYDGSKGVQR
jgi:hypothetical protein